ncbi:MAG: hypothetical protein ABII76_01595 [Pseudomonadota bacterium]
MSAFLNALREEGTREDLLAQIERLVAERSEMCAAHDRRVSELLAANNREVERRRDAERKVAALEAAEPGLSKQADDDLIGLAEAARDLLAARDRDERTVGYRADQWDCLRAALGGKAITAPAGVNAVTSTKAAFEAFCRHPDLVVEHYHRGTKRTAFEAGARAVLAHLGIPDLSKQEG